MKRNDYKAKFIRLLFPIFLCFALLFAGCDKADGEPSTVTTEETTEVTTEATTEAIVETPTLQGKRIFFLGDSYFAGYKLDNPDEESWPSLLSKKYDMNAYNYGVSGSTVCVTDDNKNPMVKRYTQMSARQPDIIVVEGGRNDRNQNNAGKGAEIGRDNTTDERTFKGALTTIIRGLRKKYPNALILCVTVWKVNDGTTEYGIAMKEVCEYEGVPCFDATNQKLSKVYMTDQAFREKYCVGPNDVSHLNKEGMKLVLPVFEKFISEEYAKFIAQKT